MLSRSLESEPPHEGRRGEDSSGRETDPVSLEFRSMNPLPSFRSPPVVEVAIAVQFEPVEGLTGPMLGVLWSRVRDRFPAVQVHPPRDQAVEQFDPPDQPAKLNVVFGIGPPPPLVWYIREDDSELIQIQHDRFVFNWRRRDGEYPRYEHVRARFVEFFRTVQSFLREEQLADEVSLNHWEVTYVNLIRTEGCRRGSLLGRFSSGRFKI